MLDGDIINNLDCFDKTVILDNLNKKVNLKILETVDSTNSYLKIHAENFSHGDVVIAKTQTNGKGRFARKFYSPENTGIYMSILLKPTLPPEFAVQITAAAAVAVSDAIEILSGKKTEIKWVNDVLINGKKVCGILTESSLNPKTAELDRVIVGIGVNVYEAINGFDDEIKEIATAVFENRMRDNLNHLTAEIINRFSYYSETLEYKTFYKKYKERSCVTGKKIHVVSNGNITPATAKDIDDNCRLLVEYENGKQEFLNSGEISIRF